MLDCHRGPQTIKHVLSQVPQDIIDSCTAKQIASIANAINKTYHAARASTGAEIIDGDCIFINKINRIFELDDLAKLPKGKYEL